MRRVSDEQLTVLVHEALATLPPEAHRYAGGEAYSIIHNQGVIASPDRVEIALNTILEEAEEEEKKPEIGDDICCAFCQQFFEYQGFHDQIVGDKFWCGCKEEVNNDDEE